MSNCWPFPPVRRRETDDSPALLADVIEVMDIPRSGYLDVPPSRSPSAGRLTRFLSVGRPYAVGSTASRALVAACASNVLGLLSMLVSLEFPAVAAAIAGLGLAAGYLGLGTKRPETAISGLAFNCAALLLSGFFLTVAAYARLHGMNPWDPFVAQPFGP